jgi:hypothetical protein
MKQRSMKLSLIVLLISLWTKWSVPQPRVLSNIWSLKSNILLRIKCLILTHILYILITSFKNNTLKLKNRQRKRSLDKRLIAYSLVIRPCRSSQLQELLINLILLLLLSLALMIQLNWRPIQPRKLTTLLLSSCLPKLRPVISAMNMFIISMSSTLTWDYILNSSANH